MSDATDRMPTADERLPSIVEALLFASGEALRVKDLVSSIEGADADAVRAALDALGERYENEGSALRVERVGGGYQLATRSSYGAWVRELIRQRNRTRITMAGLETLAIVAYRQPITAPEIQAIRGKDPTGPLKTLLEKKLVKILGKKKVVGSPILYGTSKQFLVHFGLDTLKELPPIEAFEEFVEGLDALEIGGDESALDVDPEDAGRAEESGSPTGDDGAAAGAPEGETDDATEHEISVPADEHLIEESELDEALADAILAEDDPGPSH